MENITTDGERSPVTFKMPKRISVKSAKKFALENELKQVIILAWDGERTHVVTYGKTVEDCDQAAQGGNKIKEFFKWPEETMAEPSRVTKLKKELKEAKEKIVEIEKLLSSHLKR